MIIAGNVEDLLISEKSPVYMPNGGIEVHGGFVTDPDGNLNISVPTKLSQLENDMNLTSNFEELQNKPTTISAEQVTAIENRITSYNVCYTKLLRAMQPQIIP